jgi:uncharacterized phage-associated protein
MLKNLFDEKKAAEAAAYFLHRAKAPLTILKLMKLLYLAERTSFARFGEPLIGDRLVSMDNGPVLSLTYSHMNGEVASSENGWDTWVADRAAHYISLRKGVRVTDPDRDLLELSDGDLDVLKSVWQEFGGLDQWELVEYTHTHCPEWKDPKGSMIPMKPEELLAAVGYNAEQAAELVEHMKTRADMRAALQPH